MLFQPTNITPDEVNGSGCVDVTQDLEISWQVNGDSALTSYQITIFENNAASTQLYTTGRIALDSPHWGRDVLGEVVPIEVTIDAEDLEDAGLHNGTEYKFTIKQWWSAVNSVSQLTASVFMTRGTPTVAISTIPNPVTSKKYTFNGTFSQAQADPINTIRWYIAHKDENNERVIIYDSKNITGTGILACTYDGFFTGENYSVRLVVTSIYDAVADTGWVDFSVLYSVDDPQGTATACQLSRVNCVSIRWDLDESAYSYSVMRQEVGTTELKKIADVGQTVGQIRDYSAKSGETYKYYVYPVGQSQYITSPMITGEVFVHYNGYTIVEARQAENDLYYVLKAHYFRYGVGGITEGQIGNNNSPSLLQNFTPYPFRQGSTANYKTGSVTGYIGTINFATYEYSDTAEQVDEIMNLSTSENVLFLLDPKGHFLMIHTNGAITSQTDIGKKPMPQTVTVPWVEIGNAEEIALTASPEDDFYPLDNIRFTSLYVDVETGTLVWTVPNDYAEGSSLNIDGNGTLVQTDSGSFTTANMELDQDTGVLTATI